MKKIVLAILLFCIQNISAQHTTRKDSLQGGLRFERTCYDVLHYGLNIKIKPDEKSIEGYNEILFRVVENTNSIQIDLFENMRIDSIILDSKKLHYIREFNAVFIRFENMLLKDSLQTIRFYYSGNPSIAIHAPWEGGFVYSKDNNGKPFIGVAVQGTGASLWYPVKDSQTDEPDNGAAIKVAVPNGLMNVSNGRFTGSEDLKNGYTRWDWEVKSPINSYNITINVADYVHIHDNYNGLDLEYYVLRDNEAAAKKHFEEVKPMMECYQSKFGKYPFFEDGFKLVETSYLGMEHQSAVAYGNHFQKGYLGKDLSGTGNGLLFDYLIIHESGHEWFGNSISSADIADLWIHEAFTCYAESVYLECQFGKEKATAYINGLRHNVVNDRPIVGKYGVNRKGSNDMYYKGALMLNTIRNVINDDAKWWKLLFDYAATYRHQIITAKTVIDFFNSASGIYLTPIFKQYLEHTQIPILEFRKSSNKLEYRWKTDELNFEMPVEIYSGNKLLRLNATNNWQVAQLKMKNSKEIKVSTDKFLIDVKY